METNLRFTEPNTCVLIAASKVLIGIIDLSLNVNVIINIKLLLR